MSLLKGILGVCALIVVIVGLYVAGAWRGMYGVHEGAGTVTNARVPAAVVANLRGRGVMAKRRSHA